MPNLKGLRNLLGIGDGLFGPEIARRAREHGVITFAPYANPNEVLGPMRHWAKDKPEWLQRLTHRFMNTIPLGYGSVSHIAKNAPNFRGVAVNPAGKAVKINRNYPHDFEIVNPGIGGDTPIWDKLREAQILADAGVGPRALGLIDVIKRHGLSARDKNFKAKLHDILKQEFGDQYILKNVKGYASKGIHTEKHKVSELPAGNLARWMVQPRISMSGISPQEKAIEPILRRVMGEKLYKYLATIDPGKKGREYRVSVIGGKVIPYAAMSRSSVTGITIPPAILHPLESAKVERFSRKVLSKLPERYRQGTYGFDVGIDQKGKPFMIELNPAEVAGASGYVEHPHIIDALTAATKGRLPLSVKLRNLLGLTAVGVPTTAIVKSKLEGNSNNPYAGLQRLTRQA